MAPSTAVARKRVRFAESVPEDKATAGLRAITRKKRMDQDQVEAARRALQEEEPCLAALSARNRERQARNREAEARHREEEARDRAEEMEEMALLDAVLRKRALIQPAPGSNPAVSVYSLKCPASSESSVQPTSAQQSRRATGESVEGAASSGLHPAESFALSSRVDLLDKPVNFVKDEVDL